MYKLVLTLIYLGLLSISSTNVAQNKTKQKKPKDPEAPQLGSLFKTDQVLAFDLYANFKAIKNDRGEKTSKHSAQVRLVNRSEKPITIPLTLKVRGNFRKATENCSFPPLLMDFDKKAKNKAAFKSQNKLKLVTHCSSNKFNEREYLVYKLYNIISKQSFRARPAKINYIDSSSQKTENYAAFLIEDVEDLAYRKKMKLLDNVRLQHRLIDSTNMATVALFEYLIGNTDWSVGYLHNTEVFLKDSTTYLVVPYDFDHSGLVNANYARPHPELGISSVRERLYRSINFSNNTYQKVFANFQAKKPEIIKLYTESKLIDESYRKYALNYIESFYKELDKPKKLIESFQEATKGSTIY
jgi:hypothetical protein